VIYVPREPRTAHLRAIDVAERKEVFTTRQGRCAVALSYPEVSGLASRAVAARINRLIRARVLATLPGPRQGAPDDEHPLDDDCRVARDRKPRRALGERPPSGMTNVEVSYGVGLLGRGLLSVVFDTFVDTNPSAHPGDVYASITIDLASGTELALADFFRPAAPWRAGIARVASEWSDAHLKGRTLGPSPRLLENPPEYYLTDVSLVLVDVCGAQACRGMQIPVPLSALRPLLRPEWERRLLEPKE
jgi:hypothetical protein